MKRPSVVLIPSLALIFGCARTDLAGPQTAVQDQRMLTTLEVTPTKLVLVPGGTNQLTIKAWDQFGAPMLEPVDGNGNGEWARKISYVTGSPQIAEVNGRGLVNGVAPGTTTITATLTLGAATRTASASASVSRPTQGFAAGVYDLTARINTFDPVWGDLTGYQYTVVITKATDGTSTFQEFRLMDSTGSQYAWIGAGYVYTYIDFAGREVDELVASNFHFSLIAPVQDALDLRRVTGTWGCCGHIAGAFTANRRP